MITEEKRKHVKKLSEGVQRAFSGSKAAVTRDTLYTFVTKHRKSVAAAALAFDMEKNAAERLLYVKKPTEEQKAHAVEYYDKGLSLEEACVRARVHPKHFAAAVRERDKVQPKRHRTYYV